MTSSVSIIIAAYNAKRTIKRCLKSAVSQKITKDIIVVDDCSTDGTLNVLIAYGKKYCNLNVIHNNIRKGPAFCRNLALTYATGDFICFLDADDSLPDKHSLSIMCNHAVKTNTTVCGSVRECKLGYKVIKQPCPVAHPERNYENIYNYYDYQMDYDYTSYIFSRKMIMDHHLRFPKLKRYQDVPFFIKTMMCAGTFSMAQTVGYRYTIPKNLAVKLDQSQVDDLIYGLMYTIVISKVYHLTLLENRTVFRLKKEYWSLITSQASEYAIGKLQYFCQAYRINLC